MRVKGTYLQNNKLFGGKAYGNVVYRKTNRRLEITCRIVKTLHIEKAEISRVSLIETPQFGRMLVLDGAIQTLKGRIRLP